MDLNANRRASSAGYRLPERSIGTRSTSEPPAGTSRGAKGQAAHGAQNPDMEDPVKQDLLWKELVWRERRTVLEWENSWNALKEFYQKGQMKPEEPLPNYVSLFSDRFPNTANQTFGSRLYTPLGRELVRLDRLILWPVGQRKHKPDPELVPC